MSRPKSATAEHVIGVAEALPEREIVKTDRITIRPPQTHVHMYELVSRTCYTSNKFSQEAFDQMRTAQAEGQRSKNVKKLGKKDFKRAALGSAHMSTDGWYGIPTEAFRAALIDACRLTQTKMTVAKMTIFIEPDGEDLAGVGLVRIIGPKPRQVVHPVRNQNGSCDLRARMQWPKWGVKLKVEFDSEQFTSTDIANLIAHAGRGIGVGAGRPFSKMSSGMNWGRWTLKS